MTERRDQVAFHRDLAATAALALYSFVVAVGFVRVFSGWSFLTDLTLLVIIGHGGSFVLRRLRVNGWFVVPIIVAAMTWTLLMLNYRATMQFFVPTEATWDQLSLDIGLVRDQFATAIAPVLYGTGWATLAGLAMILSIGLADAFAFQAEARGEALVPGGVLYVFIAALGDDRLRVAVTVALIAAGVVAAVALRSLHDRQRSVELSGRTGRSSFVLPAAIGSAVAVALLAGLVGPRIPGADAEPLYDTHGRNGSVTNVDSPLVDIRSRLTNRGNYELFKVNADSAAYWRMTTLPEFDGRTFKLPKRSLERVEGEFGTVPEGGRTIRQKVQVLALTGQLVPAAADPIQANGSTDDGVVEIRLNINTDTSTLLAPDELQPGDQFTIVSASPQLSPEVLRSTTSSGVSDPIFLELPDGLPSVVSELAAEVTAGQPTSYDQAIALQDWFRTFEYSLEVQQGHGTNAIESFLQQRVGYCEQFAATYAAMARTLGIPSRVAVGYTPGLLGNDGWYSVLGKNAHAWPELWFDGVGWVGFEPTPGRGAPGATEYTDVVPAQDETGPVAGPIGGEVIVNPTTPPTVVPPDEAGAGAPPTTRPTGAALLPDGGMFDPQPAGGANATPRPPDQPTVPWPVFVLVGLIVLLLALPAIVRRFRRRAARSGSTTDRIELAWHRARLAAQDAGVAGRSSMTTREWAVATANQLPIAARPMRSLADVVDRVSYAPPGTVDLERAGSMGPTLGQDCELWSVQIGRIADDMLSPWQRFKRYVMFWR